jgi:hypothetical protein
LGSGNSYVFTFGVLLVKNTIKLRRKYAKKRIIKVIDPHLLFFVETGYVCGVGIKVKISKVFQNFCLKV